MKQHHMIQNPKFLLHYTVSQITVRHPDRLITRNPSTAAQLFYVPPPSLHSESPP